ncbi:MAG: T9SS C-terminal target domain-containing protein, partial [Bacteroidetes bacterium]|nr:T9SS C-terminal target domain-containing protein [Bacteroidota bacterium]
MKHLLLYIFLLICPPLFSQAPSVIWENSIGGLTDDYGYFLEGTADGGYIVVGSSTSADADMPGNFGNYDVLLTKLDNTGSIVWTKNIGGSDLEEGYNVHQTVDGGYLIT